MPKHTMNMFDGERLILIISMTDVAVIYVIMGPSHERTPLYGRHFHVSHLSPKFIFNKTPQALTICIMIMKIKLNHEKYS